jgi:RHS repeat-associated protein
MTRKRTIRLFLLIHLSAFAISYNTVAQDWRPSHKIGTVTGVYSFSYNQTPSQLVEVLPAAASTTGLTYQWFSSAYPTTGFTAISGATSGSYSPAALTSTSQATYYYRQTTHTASSTSINSNIIKIAVVSVNWEDMNYVREHDVMTTGITTWTSVDQLTIGQKLQTTRYLDGIGRSLQTVSRETATPVNPNDTWGDIVKFSRYDEDNYGREIKKYLPYTTTSQSGKYKTTASTEQGQYYSTIYNETYAYSQVTFDNSPINRITNIKAPGTSWAAATGMSAVYDINTLADDVQIFDIDYTQGNPPVKTGVYPASTLYKLTATDENGKLVIKFFSNIGQVILKKIQLDDNPSGNYDGWICTYYVYDDFGLLRYEIQPEGVKYLSNNSWSFAGTNGQTVLAEQVFQFNYDTKGKEIWKKTPGAQPLNMLYDIRDRVVFMQDGNQAGLSTPQWTANLYDELDRPIITTLYNTSKTISQLQTDINNAVTVSSVTVTNPSQSVTDLVLNNRQAGITLYEASNSIELVSDANGSFESVANDEFTAQINATASSGGSTVTITNFTSPISQTDLNNASVTTVLKYLFYDNYSFGTVKSFNSSYTNLSAYSTSDPNVLTIAKTVRTTSMATGSLTRVLGSNTFLSATIYYNDRGQMIQGLKDNIKSGVDITTAQHHFDGRTLSVCSNHTAAGGGYNGYITLTKYLFDKLGRVTSIQKQFGSNAFKTITSYDYDDAGRVKTKHLDPGYTAGGNTELESLNYSFNIHNQLTGINKDYALKNPSNYNKWGHFFGLYLGFDNRDNVFTSANLTGQSTGVVWNTQGDDAQRRYNYTYDNAGRLTIGAFTEKKHTGDTWSNSQMDFSVSGTNGKINYDLNGNLVSMWHKGVLPGTASPTDVDKLAYTYASYSNKLQSVTDNMTSTSVNGMFGDFKDGTNGSNPDYVYDNNGNLVIDLNKNAKDLGNVTGANGIKYNFMDKPEEIRIAGKGTIKIVYSADGEKLQRLFTPEPSGATITTTYINQFVYQESGSSGLTLQFINFEGGRIRVVTPTSQGNGLDALVVDGNMDLLNGKRGAYDYYITDYQQNVRMILTEETHTVSNTATMETSRATLEESIFGQTGTSNEVATTRYATASTNWTGNTSGKVSRLGTTSGHNIGSNVLQKVMAGDKVSASVQYYYSTAPGGNNTTMVSTMLGSLVSAISGSSASDLVKGNVSNISTQLGGLSEFGSAVQPNGSNPGGTTPQAFLTILFFDERFNFIASADGGVAQQQVASSVASNGASLGLSNVKAPKNGYVYVYVSNQSNDDVYFDDFNVGIAAGNIIEENHYYAYGLKITTLSSKKLGDSYEGELKNKYLYQGAYSEMDEEIGWNDFALRNYDPQIGRWVQQDPYQEFASSYVGMGDDPVNLVDPSGGSVETLVIRMAIGAAIGSIIDYQTGGSGAAGFVIGAFAGLLSGIHVPLSINAAIKGTNIAANIINTSLETHHAGGAEDPKERLRMLATIAMWEGGGGNDFTNINNFVEIAQIYINRVNKGMKFGKGSGFYKEAIGTKPTKNKHLLLQRRKFRNSMRILGSPNYAKDKADAQMTPRQVNILKEIYNALERNEADPGLKKDLPAVQNKDMTGQGYEGDLNCTSPGINTLEKYKEWNMKRWFVYLQLVWQQTDKTIRIFYDEVSTPYSGDMHTTFLFDETALKGFIKKFGVYLENIEAPQWDPNTNKFSDAVPCCQPLQFKK